MEARIARIITGKQMVTTPVYFPATSPFFQLLSLASFFSLSLFFFLCFNAAITPFKAIFCPPRLSEINL
jgi:hypothetical protein